MVPILYGDKVIDGIMKGYNQQLTTMKINLADAIFQTAGAFFLIPKTGIFGYVAIFCFGSFFNFALSYFCLKKTSNIRLPIREGVLKPLLIALSTMLPLKIIGRYIHVSVWIWAGLAAVLFIAIFRLYSYTEKKGRVRKNLRRSTPNIPTHGLQEEMEENRMDPSKLRYTSTN